MIRGGAVSGTATQLLKDLRTPPRTPYREAVLHGRDRETDRLVAMLDVARSGHASSLLISAGAGVGKSALMASMSAQTHGATVAIATS